MKKTIRNIVIIACPLVLGFLSAVISRHFITTPMVLLRLEFLLDTIISSSATISGFILASVTILVGATTSKIMQDIKNNLALPELRWRYSETLILGLIVMVYFTYLGISIGENNEIGRTNLVISVGMLTAYLFSVITTCYYLLSIIGKINDDPPISKGEPSAPEGDFR